MTWKVVLLSWYTMAGPLAGAPPDRTSVLIQEVPTYAGCQMLALKKHSEAVKVPGIVDIKWWTVGCIEG